MGYCRPVRHLWRDIRANAALEFAVVGPVFIILICIGFNLSLVLFTQVQMDMGVAIAAREVQIGALGGSSNNAQTNFVGKVCESIKSIVNCTENLQVVAVSSTTYKQLAANVPVMQSSGKFNKTSFSIGSAGSVVLFEVGYKMPYSIPMGTLGTGSFLLQSSYVVMNEDD